MKRIFSLAVCLLTAAALFAQPQGNKQFEEQRKKEFDRIQAEKIAFITQELDLSPAEAQVFWPVYNACWKESHAAHKKMMDAFGEFRGKKGGSRHQLPVRGPEAFRDRPEEEHHRKFNPGDAQGVYKGHLH